MKKYITVILSMSILASCSFKSKENGDGSGGAVSREEALSVDLKKVDSDGDLINDYDELESGRDRYIADIPKLNVNFLQDYNINVQFEDESSFVINTVVRRDNPDFKYRVGNLYLKENSLNNAARVGRFSGISWGSIKQEDLSWVKYPKIDKEFFHTKVHEFDSRHRSKVIKELNIELENTLQLESGGQYSQIENLEVNFYYYSHEKEKNILVHTQMIEKVFQAGTRESFNVTIINPPHELLTDSYLRRGEFIISEVKDFYIPELKKNYSDLISSVKNKSIPVYITTPFENSLQYIGVDDKGESFISVLKKMYSDKFKVESEKLTQLEQFSNNLRSFKYLSELSGVDKEGKWFVMTNKIKSHYLKHSFNKTDLITLSYITGDELSKRIDEDIFMKKIGSLSAVNPTREIIGNITNNSMIDLLVYPDSIVGRKLVSTPGVFTYSPPRCRNCTGTNWGIKVNFSINKFSDLRERYQFTSVEHALSGIEIQVNNTTLKLSELIERNNAEVILVNGKFQQFLKIQIKNIHELNLIKSGQENIAYVKINSFDIGKEAEGVKCDSASGKNVDVNFHAGLVTFNTAHKNKLKIAVSGWNFDKWQKEVHWGEKQPDGWVPTRGEYQNFYKGQLVDIVSTITNYVN